MFLHVFLYISMHISFGLFSLGSAETDIKLGRKLNGNLIASCVWNIRAKNYENLICFYLS